MARKRKSEVASDPPRFGDDDGDDLECIVPRTTAICDGRALCSDADKICPQDLQQQAESETGRGKPSGNERWSLDLNCSKPRLLRFISASGRRL